MMRLSFWKDLISFNFIFGLAILILPCYGSSDSTPEVNEGELVKIENRLSSEKEKLRNLGFQEKGLLDDLARLDQEVTDKKNEVDGLIQKIRYGGEEIDGLKWNLSELRQSSMEAQKKVSKKLVEFYKHGRIGCVNALLDVSDINDLLRRIKYFTVVMKQDRMSLIRATRELQTSEIEISKTEAKIKELTDISRKEEARLMALKKELENKVFLLVNIHQDKKFYETAVQELETAAEGLKQAFIDIEKGNPFETNQPFRFEDFKGKLPWPMQGNVLKEQSLPKSDSLGKCVGIVIEGPQMSDVLAVFPGKVAFSGRLKGYGEVVIIHHGSRFFTVSAQLSVRNKIEEDVVKEGDVVGHVAGNGISKGGRLYFEIRRGEKGLNPYNWLKTQ